MIDPHPLWTYASPTDLTQAYGWVQLVGDCAVGQWCCIELDSGRSRWENQDLEVNSVFEIGMGVIVAYTVDSKGPTTVDYGGCGISVETGEVLWELPSGAGLLKFLWYLVRGRVDELAPGLVHVRGHECACSDGTIIDIRNGRRIRVERDLSEWERERDVERAEQMHWLMEGHVGLPNNDQLVGGMHGDSDGALLLARVSEAETPVWEFHSHQHGVHGHVGHARLRLQGDHAYMLVTDRPAPLPPDKQPGVRRDWSLWVLGLRDGHVAQRVPLATATPDHYRIEDLDERHLLLSRSDRHLSAYRVGDA